MQVLLFENKGDILVFLTGQEEIEDLARGLQETLSKVPKELADGKEGFEEKVVKIDESQLWFKICPLYANMPSSE